MTTPPGSRFRRRLTDHEIGLIQQDAKDYGSLAGFDRLWDIIFREAEGVTWAEAVERGLRFAVRDYAIPADQDKAIQRLLSVPPRRANRKRWSRRSCGMNFLFWGPANYDEGSEK